QGESPSKCVCQLAPPFFNSGSTIWRLVFLLFTARVALKAEPEPNSIVYCSSSNSPSCPNGLLSDVAPEVFGPDDSAMGETADARTCGGWPLPSPSELDFVLYLSSSSRDLISVAVRITSEVASISLTRSGALPASTYSSRMAAFWNSGESGKRLASRLIGVFRAISSKCVNQGPVTLPCSSLDLELLRISMMRCSGMYSKSAVPSLNFTTAYTPRNPIGIPSSSFSTPRLGSS